MDSIKYNPPPPHPPPPPPPPYRLNAEMYHGAIGIIIYIYSKFQETKAKLVQITQKLKEAKEEGEQIRTDCQAIIKQYQVCW